MPEPKGLTLQTQRILFDDGSEDFNVMPDGHLTWHNEAVIIQQEGETRTTTSLVYNCVKRTVRMANEGLSEEMETMLGWRVIANLTGGISRYMGRDGTLAVLLPRLRDLPTVLPPFEEGRLYEVTADSPLLTQAREQGRGDVLVRYQGNSPEYRPLKTSDPNVWITRGFHLPNGELVKL